MKRDQWVEVEDEYLTNQPRIGTGRSRGFKMIPDPEVPPTEAYLFCYECYRRPRSIKRKRFLKTIRGRDENEIIESIMKFIEREDIVLLESKAVRT